MAVWRPEVEWKTHPRGSPYSLTFHSGVFRPRFPTPFVGALQRESPLRGRWWKSAWKIVLCSSVGDLNNLCGYGFVSAGGGGFYLYNLLFGGFRFCELKCFDVLICCVKRFVLVKYRLVFINVKCRIIYFFFNRKSVLFQWMNQWKDCIELCWFWCFFQFLLYSKNFDVNYIFFNTNWYLIIWKIYIYVIKDNLSFPNEF